MGILDRFLIKNYNSMEQVKVYSPVEDKNIRENLNGSPIWGKAYHEEDLPKLKVKYSEIYEYGIKFDGLKPVQVTSVRKIVN